VNKVYKHERMARDQYLGRVDADGDVYEARFGPDKRIGKVELSSGKIYEARHGPDKYLGRVDPKTGKVYLSRLGPDELFGEVKQDGRLYHHRRMARDDYMGKVQEMTSLTHGGAAFLLLIQPAYEEEAQRAQDESLLGTGDEETGAAQAPA
jgi:hypothetical protein